MNKNRPPRVRQKTMRNKKFLVLSSAIVVLIAASLVINYIYPITGGIQVGRSKQLTSEESSTTLWGNTVSTSLILAVSVGDFNNDGKDDALAGSWDGNIYAINGATINTFNDDKEGSHN